MVTVANGLVGLAAAYVGIGLAFAIAFVLAGVNRVDPAARQGSWGFRLIILPGVVACWPWLAARWIGGRPPRPERNAHRDRAGEGGG